MENKRFLTAQDVMEMLEVSLSYAYKNLALFKSSDNEITYWFIICIFLILYLDCAWMQILLFSFSL